jgi:hypothetical protein
MHSRGFIQSLRPRQETRSRHRLLLRARRERPRGRRAAEQRDELASSLVGHGLLPGTRCASLPQAQDALEALADPWVGLNRSESAPDHTAKARGPRMRVSRGRGDALRLRRCHGAPLGRANDGRIQRRTEHLQSGGAEALRWPSVSLRTNARVKSPIRLRTKHRDAARRPWQVRQFAWQ